MTSLIKYGAQIVVYGLIGLSFVFFSNRPVYSHLDPGMAEIRLSFAHAGARKGGCKTWTRKAMAKLDPRDRGPNKCPRERVPLMLEVRVDGKILLTKQLPPSGLHKDGPSVLYQRLVTPAGRYEIELRLKDSERRQGFDYQRKQQVKLAAGDNLAIDFRPETGGFILYDQRGAY
jgi:hypothetical protein